MGKTDLAKEMIDALRRRGWRMAAAESCTGGMIASRITAVSGASEVFLGSMVTYTNEVKHRILSVKEETLDKFGAVSEETAREMADGVRERTDADIAVSVTGIAGPGGGSEDCPVGTVCFGLCVRGEDPRSVRVQFPENLTREEIRTLAAEYAMEMVRERCGG